MESTSRPSLLSPQLPRLPGGVCGVGDVPLAAAEPCLLPEEFAEPPPPIMCDPLPPDVAERLAAGQGLALALESHRRFSELAWCLEQQSQQNGGQQPDQAPPPPGPADQQEAERLARRPAPAAPAADPSAAAAERSSGNDGRSSEGRASSGPLHLQSRASAVLQPLPALDQEADEEDGPAWVADEGPNLEELLEEGLADSAPKGDTQDAAAAAPGNGQGTAAAAAGGVRKRAKRAPPPAADAAKQAGRKQSPAGDGAGAAARRRRARRQQAASAAASDAAGGAAARCDDAVEAQLAGDHAAAGSAAAAEAGPAAEAAGGRLPAGGEPGPPPATQQRGGEAEGGGEEHAEAAAGGEQAALEACASPTSPGKRQRPRAQQAIEAALAALGEASWQDFCSKLLAAAEAREGGGRGAGRRGRGRVRGGRGGSGAEVGIQDVLNKKSRVHHPAFAAAYNEAKAALEKREAKRQRKEVQKEPGKPGERWSALTAQDHAWYLQNEGRTLRGPEGKRLEQLQEKVAEEQAQYAADVEQRYSTVQYQHCTARQEAQLEEDARARRRRVQQLPRLCRLRALLPLDTAAGPPPQLAHLGSLLRSGQPPRFTPPASETGIQGNRLYLPATVQPDSGGTLGAGEQLYRKAEVAPLAEDPLLPALAQQACQHAADPEPEAPAATEAGQPGEQHPAAAPVFCLAPGAFTAIVSAPSLQGQAAWEIPVTVRASSEAAAGGSAAGGLLVCLDKPLPQRSLRQRDRQARLQKYGVLSLGVQWPAPPTTGAAAPDASPQQATPQRRSTRSAAAALAAPPDGAAAAGRGPALPPREAAYDAWQLGSRRLLVRSHGRLLLEGQSGGGQQQAARQQGEATAQEDPGHGQEGQEAKQEGSAGAAAAAAAAQPPPPGPRPAVLAVSTEYLPEPCVEEAVEAELCAWRLKLLLRPSAECLLVARVHVPKGQVLSCEALTAAELDAQLSSADGGGGDSGGHPWLASGLALLDTLLATLGTLAPGRYLLLHGAGEQACALLSALPAELEEAAGGGAAPLPAAAALTSPSTAYDLHAAHERSGAVDPRLPSFVPPVWRPHDPAVPQVPYTFPPRPAGGKQAKQRRVGMTPFAWDVLGDRGDFDQVGHATTISVVDYMKEVEDAL